MGAKWSGDDGKGNGEVVMFSPWGLPKHRGMQGMSVPLTKYDTLRCRFKEPLCYLFLRSKHILFKITAQYRKERPILTALYLSSLLTHSTKVSRLDGSALAPRESIQRGG